jgi:DNA-binding CsgD family transcriptional regulator
MLGRHSEFEAARSFLANTAKNETFFVLRGAPGIGKTMLLSAIIAEASQQGYSVLTCRPAEAEQRLAYAALTDLFAAVSANHLETLPPPQRHALEVALLRAEPKGPIDQRSVGIAVLSILESLARLNPIVLAIDDWQWLDGPSTRVLGFALRRLQQTRVPVVLSLRGTTTAERPRGLDGVPVEQLEQVTLGGLSLAALYHLLRDRLDLVIPRPLLVQLHQVSGGNPFFALEIGRSMAEVGWAHHQHQGFDIPHSLRAAVERRFANFRPGTLHSLAVAAASPRPAIEDVLKIQGSRAYRDLEAAETAGVISIDNHGRSRFDHPLTASVALTAVPRLERARIYRRLASHARDVEEQAMHIAKACPTSADLFVIDLGAAHASIRGAPDVAADLAETALATMSDHGLAEVRQRQVQVADYQFQAGNLSRARELLEWVVTGAEASTRADALWRLGRVRWQGDSAGAAIEVFREALGQADEPRLKAAITRDLALSLLNGGRVEEALRFGRAALEQAECMRDHVLVNQAIGPVVLAEFLAGNGLRADLVAKAREDLPADELPVGMRPNALLATVLKWSDCFDAARLRLEAEYARAMERGAEQDLPSLLWGMAELECWTGCWKLAAGYAEKGVELATLNGGQPGLALTFYARALVRASRGEVETARHDIDAGLAAAHAAGLRPVTAWLRLVAGFLELSRANYSAAHDWLRPLAESVVGMGVCEPGSVRFVPDSVEALVALGELEQANALLAPFEMQAMTLDRTWALATGARCRGLIRAVCGDLAGAEEAMECAVTHHEGLKVPLELGRTLLVKGQLHRRSRQKRRAKECLQEALAIFEHLGARLWAQRARADLQRVGLRPAAGHELTATEQQVARLAADGLPNRRIAEHLFLSTRSIDGVMARVYDKLGIHSRAELGTLKADTLMNKHP